MGRTIGEIINHLASADSYIDARREVSDGVVDFIKEAMPRDWERIKDRELAFQQIIALIYEANE